ncbi:single-stranded DNA-binding protein [Rhizobium phage RHph_X3_15]|nr:single-stranded DNA-binding protein [Rhizobium phage RHph_X3_15]
MSNIFGNMSSEGLEETQDRLGGFSAYDTDAYDGILKAVYAGQSDGGARSVTVIVTLPQGEYRETLWVTNKAGENFYIVKDRNGNPVKDDKGNPKKAALPGWIIFEDICLVTLGKEPKELTAEDKVMNIYDAEAKKEVPKSVPMFVELLQQPVTLGIVKTIEDKTQKDNAGNYVPTGETREVNSIEKVFHTGTKSTVVEGREAQKTGKAPEPVFYTKWVEKNKGQTRDKTDKNAAKNGGKAGRPGSNAAPQAGQQQRAPSLFGK